MSKGFHNLGMIKWSSEKQFFVLRYLMCGIGWRSSKCEKKKSLSSWSSIRENQEQQQWKTYSWLQNTLNRLMVHQWCVIYLRCYSVHVRTSLLATGKHDCSYCDHMDMNVLASFASVGNQWVVLKILCPANDQNNEGRVPHSHKLCWKTDKVWVTYPSWHWSFQFSLQ